MIKANKANRYFIYDYFYYTKNKQGKLGYNNYWIREEETKEKSEYNIRGINII